MFPRARGPDSTCGRRTIRPATCADQPPARRSCWWAPDSEPGSAKPSRNVLNWQHRGSGPTSIMLFHVPGWQKPALISMPRDSYVDIPKNWQEQDQRCVCVRRSAVWCRPSNENTGLRIDGYMEIGVRWFRQHHRRAGRHPHVPAKRDQDDRVTATLICGKAVRC